MFVNIKFCRDYAVRNTGTCFFPSGATSDHSSLNFSLLAGSVPSFVSCVPNSTTSSSSCLQILSVSLGPFSPSSPPPTRPSVSFPESSRACVSWANLSS